STLTTDIPLLQGQLGAVIADAIGAPLMIGGGVACLLLINWQLALLSLTCLPFTAWLILLAGRQQKRAQARGQALNASITALTQEGIAGARTVRAFAAEAWETDRFRARNRQALRTILRSNLVRAAVPPGIEAIGAAAFVLVLGYGGYQIVSGAR